MFSILKKRKEKKNNIHRFIDGWIEINCIFSINRTFQWNEFYRNKLIFKYATNKFQTKKLNLYLY